MGVFEHFPYTNFHNINLDWIIEKVKNNEENIKTVTEVNEDLQNTITLPDVIFDNDDQGDFISNKTFNEIREKLSTLECIATYKGIRVRGYTAVTDTLGNTELIFNFPLFLEQTNSGWRLRILTLTIDANNVVYHEYQYITVGGN